MFNIPCCDKIICSYVLGSFYTQKIKCVLHTISMHHDKKKCAILVSQGTFSCAKHALFFTVQEFSVTSVLDYLDSDNIISTLEEDTLDKMYK